jgi:hypothetical protein
MSKMQRNYAIQLIEMAMIDPWYPMAVDFRKPDSAHMQVLLSYHALVGSAARSRLVSSSATLMGSHAVVSTVKPPAHLCEGQSQPVNPASNTGGAYRLNNRTMGLHVTTPGLGMPS